MILQLLDQVLDNIILCIDYNEETGIWKSFLQELLTNGNHDNQIYFSNQKAVYLLQLNCFQNKRPINMITFSRSPPADRDMR